MNTNFYDQFAESERLGLSDQAKKAAEAFVLSVASVEESRDWVLANLPELQRNGADRIRHEIYVGVIFPVLLDGYRRGCPECYYWLAMTEQNLLSAKECHERIARAEPVRLLKAAVKAKPRKRQYSKALLDHLIARFDYMDHEWPAGILSGVSGMTDGWDALKKDIALARKLDKHHAYHDRLDEFADRLETYQARVQSAG